MGAFGGGPGVVDDILTQAGALPPPATRAEAPAEPAPAQATKTARRPPQRRTAPPAKGAPSALVPPAPEDRYTDRQQLNIRIPRDLHWALRASTFMTNDSMSRLVTGFLQAYAEDPDLWVELFNAVRQSGATPGSVLNPAARAALEALDQAD